MSEPAPEQRPGADFSAIRDIRPAELAVRFGLGALVSAVAAVVGLLAGARDGGILLAAPAILMASITLLARDKGVDQAREDTHGAFLGAWGLLAFAAVGALGFHRLATPLVLALAVLAWLVTAAGLFALDAYLHDRRILEPVVSPRAAGRQDRGEEPSPPSAVATGQPRSDRSPPA